MAATVDKTLLVVGAVISLNIVTVIGTYLTSMNDKLKYRLLVAQFHLIYQALLFFVARYVWVRVCPPLFKSPSVFKRGLMLIVAAILVLAQCCVFSGIILAGVEPHSFTLLTYTCFGITLLLATVSLLVDLLWWMLSFLKIPFGSHFYRTSRQQFKVLLVLAICTVLTLHGIQSGLKQPTVRRFTIPLKDLPLEFKGLTIVQLSDLHIGSTVGRTGLEQVVKKCNELEPDMLVLTGDLVDSTVYQIRQAVKPLLRLKTKYGIFFVTGNHEYYTGDVDAWMVELGLLGIKVLHNSHVTVKHPKKPTSMLSIVGVDDVEGSIFRYGEHGMQLEKALANLKPHTATILLAHQPKAAQIALKTNPNIGLVLSGHTHGGQMFPFHLYHYLLQPYFAGLYQHERGSYIYVNSGTFFWGFPMRVFSSSEIAHLTLSLT